MKTTKINADVISRFKSMPSLSNIPDTEYNWLIQHGNFEVFQPGLIFTKGSKMDQLWIILSGSISVRIDRGTGPKVANPELKSGSVTGMLPYSRLKELPGDVYVDEKSEMLSISTEYFPEMINKCPEFTAHTVHMMIDRARIHNTSAMQDEKLHSLGRMAAGLAHELNNPSSALIRAAKLLKENQTDSYNASCILQKTNLNETQFKKIQDFRSKYFNNNHSEALTPIQKSDFQEKITTWFSQHHINTLQPVQLADMAVDTKDLDNLLQILPIEIFRTAIQWIVASCNIYNLSREIEQSTTRVYNLVEIVKKFTHMDNLSEIELVNIETGINDVLPMLGSKTKLKNAEINFNFEKNLPTIYANKAALNQVWFNLIDNALDAISNSGKIQICGGLKNNQLVIKFIDNGSGIPTEKIDRIFDPFYTTKPPGQGTGLGLDLSRRIIQALKGDIKVQSTKEQTEFCVYLNIDK